MLNVEVRTFPQLVGTNLAVIFIQASAPTVSFIYQIRSLKSGKMNTCWL